MTAKKLPEPKFYSVEMLAKKWGCTPELIIKYGIGDQLKLSVLSRGWHIEYGEAIEEPNGCVTFLPTNYIYYAHEPLNLCLFSTMDIIRNGSTNNPSFDFDDKKYNYASISDHHHNEKITVTKDDLIIDLKDVLEFEKLNGMVPPPTGELPTDMPVPAEAKTITSEAQNKVKDRGGRTPIYDWLAFDREIVRRANHPDGLPEKRELTKDMEAWAAEEWEKSPDSSQIRYRVNQLYPEKN